MQIQVVVVRCPLVDVQHVVCVELFGTLIPVRRADHNQDALVSWWHVVSQFCLKYSASAVV